MSKVSMWVKLPIKEGKREEAKAIIGEALANVQSEPGTLLYILHEDGRDENVLYFYELYTDGDALAAHGASDWFKEFGPKLGPVLAGRPEMQMITPVGGKGL
jgi:quinol monooxygenase YgiN